MFRHPNSDDSFYRQSSWMVFATATANILSFAVNFMAPWMTMAEYGLMATLLQLATLMMIPAMGLQAIFAMEAATSVSPQETDELARKASALLLFTGLLWLALALLAFLFQADISRHLKISRAASFWITISIGLPQLWLPIMMGLLQGRQDFRWLGWAMIANGAGRFCSVVLFVAVLGGQAAGAMTGILIGTGATFAICAWHTRTIWLRKPAGFDWRPWLGRILPLTVGLGSCQFMMSADMIFARNRFEASQTGLYSAAGVLARGLVILTGPIVAVMFPKVVGSLRRSEPTNALGDALKATATLAGSIAAACTAGAWISPFLLAVLTGPNAPLTGKFREALVLHKESLLFVAQLIPWFVWSMLPLAVGNVLVAYLVARRFHWYIAGLGLIAGLYALVLSGSSGTMIAFVRTIGLFNLLFCLLAAAAHYPGILRFRTRVPNPFNLFRNRKRGFAAGSQPCPKAPDSPNSRPSSLPPACPICASISVRLVCQGYPGYVQGTNFDIYGCRGCEARFIDMMSARADLYNSIYSIPGVTGYDRYSRYITRVRQEEDPLRFLASYEAGYFVVYQHLRRRSNLRILDVGCGYGYLTYAMRRQGFEASGLDISQEAVNVAREAFGDFYHHADIDRFAEEQEKPYDLVVALELIEHLSDPLTCLKKLLRLLAPGGVLLLTTPNRDFYRQDSIWRTDLPPVHTIWLGRKSVGAMARSLGCEYRVKTLTDFYPKHENKLAKYIGCRRQLPPTPMITAEGLLAGQPQGYGGGMRRAANWVLHECGPVRMACNILHNRVLKIDETLVLMLWRDDGRIC